MIQTIYNGPIFDITSNYSLKFRDNSIKNPNSLQNLHPIRTYKDIMTDAFVETFFRMNREDFINFVDFVFHKINLNLHINIDEVLKINNFQPLHNDETISFYAKGGNIMFILFHLMNRQINGIIRYRMPINLNNDFARRIGVNLTQYETGFYNIQNSFKLSDVDFGININTTNNNRYNEIYNCMMVILLKSLEEIQTFFENLKNGRGNILPTGVDSNDSDFITDNHQLYINIIKKLRTYNIGSFSQDELNYIDNLCNYDPNINQLYKCMYNSIINNILINYIEQRLINKNINVYQQNRRQYINKINLILQQKQFYLNQFYTPVKLDRLKTIFTNLINGDNNNYNYKYDDRSRIRIVRFNADNINDFNERLLDFRTRNNFAVLPPLIANDQSRIIEDANPNIHYISFNNTIETANPLLVVNFDLVRIKFNLTINNSIEKGILDPVTNTYNRNRILPNYNCPSEFIDVSIIKYNDSNNGHNYNSLLSYTVNRKTLVINSYSSDEILDDLVNLMYIQGTPFPWQIAKYEKRIFRQFFFIKYKINPLSYSTLMILFHNILTILQDDTVDFHLLNGNILFLTRNNSRIIYNQLNDILINRNYDNNHLNTIIFLNEYDHIKPILINVFIHTFIYKQPDAIALNIITYLSNIYNITPEVNINIYRQNFYKFIVESIIFGSYFN